MPQACSAYAPAMSNQRLAGTVALVTGAARGQGAAEAELFIGEGACVVLADVMTGPVGELAERLGERALAVTLDVREPSQWVAAVARASAGLWTSYRAGQQRRDPATRRRCRYLP